MPKEAKTQSAPSGKQYVIALAGYPQEKELHGVEREVITAARGDLIELVAIHNGWGYGKRFKSHEGCVNEGAFRLEWICGVQLTIQGGIPRPIEVDISSPAYGFRTMDAGKDSAAKLQAQLLKVKMAKASKSWAFSKASCYAVKAAVAEAEAIAAELEKEEKEIADKAAKKRRKAEARKRKKGSPQGKNALPVKEEPSTVPQSEVSWEASWEQEAARLEQQMSESSCVEDVLAARNISGENNLRPATQKKKTLRRRLTNGLLDAKRSGELHQLAETWKEANTELASKASDLNALKEKVKHSPLSAHREGDLERIAAETAERKAEEMQVLKNRVLRAIIDLKRSGNLHRIAGDMQMAQNELEIKASQLKELMMRARKGLLQSKRSGELQRLVEEMAELFQMQAQSIRQKLQKSLLEAHRSGQLSEIADELGELGDVVTSPVNRARRAPRQRRWEECSSDSDSWYANWNSMAGRNQIIPGTCGSQSEADASSDTESWGPRWAPSLALTA